MAAVLATDRFDTHLGVRRGVPGLVDMHANTIAVTDEEGRIYEALYIPAGERAPADHGNSSLLERATEDEVALYIHRGDTDVALPVSSDTYGPLMTVRPVSYIAMHTSPPERMVVSLRTSAQLPEEEVKRLYLWALRQGETHAR